MLRTSLVLSATLLLSAFAFAHAFAFAPITIVQSQGNAPAIMDGSNVAQPSDALSLGVVDLGKEDALDGEASAEESSYASDRKLPLSQLALWGSVAAITVYGSQTGHSHADAILATAGDAPASQGSDVPEPATMVLLGGGLLALGFRRKK